MILFLLLTIQEPYLPPLPPTVQSQIYSVDGKKIYVTGGPDEGFTERLKKVLDRYPNANLVQIDSGAPGFTESLAAARLLNSRGITIKVENQCSRGCAYLWAATNKRWVGKFGAIAITPDTFSRSPANTFTPMPKRPEGKQALQILTGAGIPRERILQSWKNPRNLHHWLSSDELIRLQVHLTRSE